MKCREFNEQAECLTLGELAAWNDEQLLAHQRECADCASWLQQRQSLAGAMQGLRNSTASLEAGVDVERAVLRAFRQASPSLPVQQSQAPSLAFTFSRLFGWGAYAAVAAALAIALGLGVWYWQTSAKTSQSAAQPTRHPLEETVSAKAETAQPAIAASSATAMSADSQQNKKSAARLKNVAAPKAASEQSLARLAQAQGYVPLMLCDPLSCSGDEQVVRMEIPASSVDASNGAEPLVADVVVGDDGLVRAIRIVQQ
jgi:hypothetical protein